MPRPLCTSMAETEILTSCVHSVNPIPVRGLHLVGVCAPNPVLISTRQEWQVFNTALDIFSSMMNLDKLNPCDYHGTWEACVRQDL